MVEINARNRANEQGSFGLSEDTTVTFYPAFKVEVVAGELVLRTEVSTQRDSGRATHKLVMATVALSCETVMVSTMHTICIQMTSPRPSPVTRRFPVDGSLGRKNSCSEAPILRASELRSVKTVRTLSSSTNQSFVHYTEVARRRYLAHGFVTGKLNNCTPYSSWRLSDLHGSSHVGDRESCLQQSVCAL